MSREPTVKVQEPADPIEVGGCMSCGDRSSPVTRIGIGAMWVRVCARCGTYMAAQIKLRWSVETPVETSEQGVTATLDLKSTRMPKV